MSKIYLLNDDKFEGILNLPMIKINFFQEEIDLELYDALIFTSKNAVRAIDNIDKHWIKKEIYSIGQGTSKEIKRHEANLAYTAKNSHGDSFANEIKQKLKNKKTLFLRAKKVTSKLNFILKNSGVKLHEKIIYETTCQEYKKSEKPSRNSIILFTSPSTLNCFLKNFDWDESYKAIAIGEVTGKSIPAYIKKTIAKEQTISSCIETAKSIDEPYN